MMALIALPLIVGATRESLQSIPHHVREASYALGKDRISTIRRVLLPASRRGIGTGITLGMGRIVGDTAIVVVLLGASLLLVGCGRSKEEIMAEAAVCHGITGTFFTSEDVTRRIANSMSASDRPLGERSYELSVKANNAFKKLIGEKKVMSEEKYKKAVVSGQEIANKISTYAEMKKRFDECDKIVAELAKLAGTN